MRTTVTLDDDVANQLQRLGETQKKPFRRVLNEVLRAGLAVLMERPSRRRKFRISPVSLGRPRLPDLDNVAEVLAVGEGERHA